MAKTTEEIEVIYNADMSQYNSAVEGAEDASTDLVETQGDLSTAFEQTTAGAIDSATGVTGLGTAVTNMGQRALAAVKNIKAFSAATIAIGAGAVIAALALIITFWDDIAKAIGLAEEELEEFNDKAAKFSAARISNLNTQLQTLIILGATEEQINAKRLQVLESEERAAKAAFEFQRQRLENGFILLGFTQEQAKIEATFAQESDTNLKALKLAWDLATASVSAYNEEMKLLEAEQARYNNRFVETIDLVKSLNPELLKTVGTYDLIIDKQTELDKLNKRQQLNLDNIAKGEENLAKIRIQSLTHQQELAQSAATIGLAIAKENQAVQGAILIAEAIANTALAVTKVTAQSGVIAPLLIPSIIASGVAQVATIAAQMGASGGASISNPAIATPPETTREDIIESSVPDTLRQPQVVLVTEDLEAVQNSVAVVEGRASLS